MAQTPPPLRPSEIELNILKLINSIIAEDFSIKFDEKPNSKDITLSDSDSSELYYTLIEYIEHRDTIEKFNFIERISNPTHENICKELYLTGRRRFGRTRVLASQQWEEFKARLGQRSYSMRPVREMDLSTFERMEMKLFKFLGVSETIAERSITLSRLNKEIISQIRRGQRNLEIGLISNLIRGIAAKLNPSDQLGLKSLKFDQVVGLSTIVTNTTVLFTTRDWGIAGTLSTMGGSIAATITPK